MKTLILIIIGTLLSYTLTAQTPQKIISLAIKQESPEWYKEQTQLWKEKVDQNPHDEDAWYNYLKAYLYSNEYNEEEFNKKMLRAKKEIPGSFTYYYFMDRLGNDGQYLDSAYMADPTNTDIWEAKLVTAITEDDQPNKVLFADKLIKSDEEDPSLYHWSYNQLASLEPKAVVLTHGDNDTFGSWILQLAKGFRQDVNVINTSLMNLEPYAKLYWRKLLPNEQFIFIKDYYEKNEIQYDGGYQYFQMFIKKLAANDVPTHLTIWSQPEYKKGMEDNFYLTGLTYKYDPTGKFSSIAALRKNFEKVYKLDYIEQRYFSNIWDEKAKHMHKMYLSGLLKLYVHYSNTGETEKKEWVEHLLTVIEPDPKKRQQFGAFIHQETGYEPIEFSGQVLNTKKFMKDFEPITPTMYASKYETTNAAYSLFISNISSQSKGSYTQYLPDSNLFTSGKFKDAFLDPMKNLYHNHPSYDEYPVVNITKEAANAYCEWLTLQYNNDPKRKFEKVTFFVPSEKEWMMAVDEQIQLQNESSCYLLNGKKSDGKEDDYQCDGGFFMVHTESYLPNKKELYCTYGNVSEMISDGSSKGGSWDTDFKDINKDKQYESAPHPTVGLRVFMKVIEQ